MSQSEPAREWDGWAELEKLKKEFPNQWKEQLPGQGTIITGAHHAIEHAKKLNAGLAHKSGESTPD